MVAGTVVMLARTASAASRRRPVLFRGPAIPCGNTVVAHGYTIVPRSHTAVPRSQSTTFLLSMCRLLSRWPSTGQGGRAVSRLVFDEPDEVLAQPVVVGVLHHLRPRARPGEGHAQHVPQAR